MSGRVWEGLAPSKEVAWSLVGLLQKLRLLFHIPDFSDWVTFLPLSGPGQLAASTLCRSPPSRHFNHLSTLLSSAPPRVLRHTVAVADAAGGCASCVLRVGALVVSVCLLVRPRWLCSHLERS